MRPLSTGLLSEEARRGWRTFCAEQGVDLTAFLEAVGRQLDARKPIDVEAAVVQARIIAAERKAR